MFINGDFVATTVASAVATLGAIGASAFLRDKITRFNRKSTEQKYLLAELQDIARHLNSNRKVLENIKARQPRLEELPAPMHILKLQIPADSMIFSRETFRFLRVEHASRAYNMALKLRNANLEIEELGRLLREERHRMFWSGFDYVLAKQERLGKVVAQMCQLIEKNSDELEDAAVLSTILFCEKDDSKLGDTPASFTLSVSESVAMIEAQKPKEEDVVQTNRSRNVWRILLAVVACGLLLSAIAGLLMYIASRQQARKRDLTSYEGVSLGAPMAEVEYDLGYPQWVEGAPSGMVPPWKFFNELYRASGEGEGSRMPEGKKIEDYRGWSYDQQGRNVTVRFAGLPARVREISCMVVSGGADDDCEPLFRVRTGYSEDQVVGALGAPDRVSYEGVVKKIDYQALGLQLTFTKRRLYMIDKVVAR